MKFTDSQIKRLYTQPVQQANQPHCKIMNVQGFESCRQTKVAKRLSAQKYFPNNKDGITTIQGFERRSTVPSPFHEPRLPLSYREGQIKNIHGFEPQPKKDIPKPDQHTVVDRYATVFVPSNKPQRIEGAQVIKTERPRSPINHEFTLDKVKLFIKYDAKEEQKVQQQLRDLNADKYKVRHYQQKERNE